MGLLLEGLAELSHLLLELDVILLKDMRLEVRGGSHLLGIGVPLRSKVALPLLSLFLLNLTNFSVHLS